MVHETKWKIFAEIVKEMSEDYISRNTGTYDKACEIMVNYEFLSPKKYWDYDE